MEKLLNGQKGRSKDLCTDLMVAASLKMHKVFKIEDDSEFGLYDDESDIPLALVLSVDIYQNIKMYQVTSEQTQILFNLNAAEVTGDLDIDITSIDFMLM